MQNKSSSPPPLGLSFIDSQVNFSLYAPHAKTCALLIFDDQDTLLETLPLDNTLNKTDSIWHHSMVYEPLKGRSYLYLLDGTHQVLDPYAKFLNTSTTWGEGAKPVATKGVVMKPTPFEWGSTRGPNHALKDLIIYEMHTRSFTFKANVKHPGTFLGLIEKIPHLKALGINAVELMPIHEFNECEVPFEGLYNYWGYSPLAYFAFMQRYGSKKGAVLDEFKTLVKALHEADIAILIDVVYNHTAEGGQGGPHYHFKDLDPSYYIHNAHGDLVDYSGCGNTLDANHFPSHDLIIDSLKYLAVDCHVDGFRFDLASTFYRDNHGTVSHPRIMSTLLEDPILSKKILIAEAWDARGLYQVGKFPKPFADWNGAYRDKVRAFIKNTPHSKGAFADALSGTASLYFEKTPNFSINFVTAHDGFTLSDLFSYNHKHNLANHEHNRDGTNDNLSYNWGHEGPSEDPSIVLTREKLQKAALAILFLSLGTPMMLMGDEYGHTRLGNNNAWCHDSDLNHFLWDKIDKDKILMINKLIRLRIQIQKLSSEKFFDKSDISWHGLKFNDPAWNKDDGFLSLHIHSGYMLILNFSNEAKTLMIPEGKWTEIFHSNKPPLEPAHSIDTSHYLIEGQCVSLISNIK